MSSLLDRAAALVDEIFPAVRDLSQALHDDPETKWEEFRSAQRVADFLAAQGFSVTRNAAGLPTALMAAAGHGERPSVGFIGEYDALPELGHACGHNLIAGAAVAAAVATAKVMAGGPGRIYFYGTPAEEGGGGKIPMVAAGLFHKSDAVLYFHPTFQTEIYGTTTPCSLFSVAYRGRPAHMMIAPHTGHNALKGLIAALQLAQDLADRLPQPSQLGAVIRSGGDDPLVIPDRAAAELCLTAPSEEALAAIMDRIMAGFRHIAAAHELEVDVHESARYLGVRPNLVLSEVIRTQLRALGVEPLDASHNPVSNDCGNVSQVVPFAALRASIGPVMPHTPEFAAAAGSTAGYEAMRLAAKALARTAVQVLTDGDLRRQLTVGEAGGR